MSHGFPPAPFSFSSSQPFSVSLLPMRILIVDDHAPFVESLKRLLTEQISNDPLLEIRSAGTLDDGIAIANEWRADITLLDPGLPNYEMEEVLASIKTSFPPPVIVITAYPDEAGDLMKMAYRYGAQNFFLKRSLNGNLISSIHSAYLRYKLDPPRES